MANTLNITSIPAPRVSLIDERTGTISREWYRFLLNLFVLTGSGSNPTSLEDLQVGPPTQEIDIGPLDPTPSGFAAYAAGSAQESQIAEIQKQLEALASSTNVSEVQSELAEVWKHLQALQLTPPLGSATDSLTSVVGILKSNGVTISAAVANMDYVPLSTVLTKTADYTITNTDTWIINNKSGSAMVLTFPAASAWPGRSVTVKNLQTQSVNSASSNIAPIDSATAGTAILLPVIGNWATMVSDGTNWVIMAQAPNNILLLE